MKENKSRHIKGTPYNPAINRMVYSDFNEDEDVHRKVTTKMMFGELSTYL